MYIFLRVTHFPNYKYGLLCTVYSVCVRVTHIYRIRPTQTDTHTNTQTKTHTNIDTQLNIIDTPTHKHTDRQTHTLTNTCNETFDKRELSQWCATTCNFHFDY